ncbi:MAG TPA: HEAT repeat domain-containing protein [Gemmataceae bacterium]|nr:HEAT repeat domain-containing protein [Gemmataceae bacterium]
MLDATTKKLIQLLQSEHAVDLRCAAAKVLGHVAARTDELAQALCEALSDQDPAFRAQVLETVGTLRIEQALPQLLARVSEGGAEAQVAAQAAARLGAKGTRALQELMGQVAPGLRRRIAAALAEGGASTAKIAALDALLDSDPGVVDAAGRSLIGQVPSLSKSEHRSLVDHILEVLQSKKGIKLPAASEAALVRVLAALADPKAEAALWARVSHAHPAELRASALQALGTLPLTSNKDRCKLLFAAAADTDFRVAAPALMILKALAVTDRNMDDWLSLLQAPDVATRRFGMEKLAGTDTAAVSEALIRQLERPDRNLRDEAIAYLGRMKHGREALARALLESESAEEAWILARALAPVVAECPPGLRVKVFARMCALLESGDRHAEALLFLLREWDTRALRDQLEERALLHRKKKAYDKALLYLRLLTRDPACAEELRFELAGCGLKVSEQSLGLEAREADPSLQQFARLIHSHEVNPGERLRQARWLTAEDLFYLGFHFVEGEKPERIFGQEALQLAIKRSPRSKLAKDAKSKLRSAGLV